MFGQLLAAIRIFPLLICVLQLSAVEASVAFPGQGTTGQGIWAGVYTEAQATRGEVVFGRHCASCHGDGLGGGDGPPLAGTLFRRNWNGYDLNRLFKKIQEKMPPEDPSRVRDSDKIDIVALI